MCIRNLIFGVNSVAVSYLIRYGSLLQNAKVLLQNATILLQNVIVVLQNATILLQNVTVALQNATFITNGDSTSSISLHY